MFLTLIFVCIIGWFVGLFTYVDSIEKTWGEIKEKNPDIEKQTEAIVVLTGGSERIRHALFMLEMNYASRLFISGVNPDVKIAELFAIYGYKGKRAKEIFKRIQLGYKATDTIENSIEIKDWVQKNNISSIRLVTSNYHISRAIIEIKSNLDDGVEIVPHPVIPLNIRFDSWWKNGISRSLFISQYNKLIAAYVRNVI